MVDKTSSTSLGVRRWYMFSGVTVAICGMRNFTLQNTGCGFVKIEPERFIWRKTSRLKEDLPSGRKSTSMLMELIFSSMTCFNIVTACFRASLMVKSLWYTSWRLCWAPSDPDPMAFASNWMNVPEGSMCHLQENENKKWLKNSIKKKKTAALFSTLDGAKL